ncbi:MAG: hypothetical protein KAV18_03185, partial [Candidatus Omnitrophica bacterium]|nr:hypothetical protein [Candidatus Omnitrophota bacterium]
KAKYALKNLPNKILAAEYKTVLPDEKLIMSELKKTRKVLEGRTRVKRNKKIKNKKSLDKNTI